MNKLSSGEVIGDWLNTGVSSRHDRGVMLNTHQVARDDLLQATYSTVGELTDLCELFRSPYVHRKITASVDLISEIISEVLGVVQRLSEHVVLLHNGDAILVFEAL